MVKKYKKKKRRDYIPVRMHIDTWFGSLDVPGVKCVKTGKVKPFERGIEPWILKLIKSF